MPRRSQRRSPEKLRRELVELLVEFEASLKRDDLRDKVRSLIPANHLLRDLGSSLVSDKDARGARDRILAYLRKYPKTLIHGDELMVVAGISEYARRVRELRVEFGWPILSGKNLADLVEDDATLAAEIGSKELHPDTYYLLADKQDRDAAFRWQVANEIRKSNAGVKNKILRYLRKNVGKPLTGEELKYLAGNRSEWARRVRELRTEEGWPVVTRNSGRPDLPVGVYLLEEDRQAERHDRQIPDSVRIEVLERDLFSCRICHWSLETANPADRDRTMLELHHIEHHADGGTNNAANLITLCNVHHRDVHRDNISQEELIELLNQ